MDSHSVTLITSLLLVIFSAIGGGVGAAKLKQPALVGSIVCAMLLGSAFRSAIDPIFLRSIADISVAILLFTIGIEFSFHRLRKVLPQVVWAAVFQIAITVIVMLGLFLLLGFGFIASVYIALATAVSSTAIVVKIYSQKSELETVHGELSLGWLSIHNVSFIPIMIVLPALLSVQSGQSVEMGVMLYTIGKSVIYSVMVLAAIVFLGKTGVPVLLDWVAKRKNVDVLLLSTIAVVLLCSLFSYLIGISTAIGAFLSGLVVSKTSQNHAVFSSIRPLRDVCAILFFVAIGLELQLPSIWGSLPLIFSIAIGLMLVKWFLVFGLSRYLGAHRKTAFLVALSMTHMSEFGFILASAGVSAGAVTTDTYMFLVALTFITMILGSALLSKGNMVYTLFYKTLNTYYPRLFSLQQEDASFQSDVQLNKHIVICGYCAVGKHLSRAFDRARIPYIVIDQNQSTVARLRSKGVMVVFGDPAEKDVLLSARVDVARAVIVTSDDRHAQEHIISISQTVNRHCKIICYTHKESDQNHLKSLGVNIIVQPEFEAALTIINRIFPEFAVPPRDISGKIS